MRLLHTSNSILLITKHCTAYRNVPIYQELLLGGTSQHKHVFYFALVTPGVTIPQEDLFVSLFVQTIQLLFGPTMDLVEVKLSTSVLISAHLHTLERIMTVLVLRIVLDKLLHIIKLTLMMELVDVCCNVLIIHGLIT